MAGISEIAAFVLPLLKHLAGQEAEKVVKQKMVAAQPAILAGMAQKGVTPPAVPVALCSRDALFRLWKAVVHSGDLADLIRDASEGAVTPVVLAALSAPGMAPPTLAAIVDATRDAALAKIFGE